MKYDYIQKRFGFRFGGRLYDYIKKRFGLVSDLAGSSIK